jgi:hypothetical protein
MTTYAIFARMPEPDGRYREKWQHVGGAPGRSRAAAIARFRYYAPLSRFPAGTNWSARAHSVGNDAT